MLAVICLPVKMSNEPSSATTLGIQEQSLAFAADERIHFSKETGTWRLEQEDGTELEYDAAKDSWVAVVSMLEESIRIFSS